MYLLQETYGEDPYLTGSMSVSYVQGLQGNHPRYVRVSSGCKAFDAYNGPENIPVPRFTFNAKVIPINEIAMQFFFKQTF